MNDLAVYEPPTEESWQESLRQRHAFACAKLGYAVQRDKAAIEKWSKYLDHVEALMKADNVSPLFEV